MAESRRLWRARNSFETLEAFHTVRVVPGELVNLTTAGLVIYGVGTRNG